MVISLFIKSCYFSVGCGGWGCQWALCGKLPRLTALNFLPPAQLSLASLSKVWDNGKKQGSENSKPMKSKLNDQSKYISLVSTDYILWFFASEKRWNYHKLFVCLSLIFFEKKRAENLDRIIMIHFLSSPKCIYQLSINCNVSINFQLYLKMNCGRNRLYFWWALDQ